MIVPDLATLTRIGQGRTAEVFALDDERVIKVARDGAGPALDREAVALRGANAAGMPVPRVYDLVDVEGRRALIMERVRGVDMLGRLGSKPWTLVGAGAKLGRLHAHLHETIAPNELPSLQEVIAQRIAASPYVPEPVREPVLAILRGLPDGDRLCHLDFHPANVMVDGDRMTVIDWPGATRGDPLADVALTTIILRGGKTTPGSPLMTRLLAPLGRKVLLGGYLRGYRAARAIDQEPFERWSVVAATLRLSYDIAGEAEALIATIEDHLTPARPPRS